MKESASIDYFSLIRKCAQSRSLLNCRRLHAHMARHGLRGDVSLFRMYAQCGALSSAQAAFDGIPCPDARAWNFMISAYARNGQPREALSLFGRMRARQGLEPDKFTFLPLVLASGAVGNLLEAVKLHELIASTPRFDCDVELGNALITMYGKCGSPMRAQSVFRRIPRPNIILWTSLISALALNGLGENALALYPEMLSAGVNLDKIAYLALVNACSTLGCLQKGKEIHRQIAKNGFESDFAIKNALLTMYGKCSSVEDAVAIFDGIRERGDLISHNAMIAAYVENGCREDAFRLFRQLQSSDGSMRPDRITFINVLNACTGPEFLQLGRTIHQHINTASRLPLDISLTNALLNMYRKCGSLKDAESIFDQQTSRRNVISWTTMIGAYAQNGHPGAAMELYCRMLSEGVRPNAITFLTVLDACTGLASLDALRAVHEDILGSGLESDVALNNSVMNAYGKVGSLRCARLVFDRMHRRNIVSWTTMIASYAQNGYGKEALELYDKMELEGLSPDGVTFLSLLDACGTLGLLEKGKSIHEQIIAGGFGVDIAVATALVVMYGKCDSLTEARTVFDGMQKHDVISWNAMITAYAQNNRGHEALELFWRMESVGVKPDRVTFLGCISACASLASLENGRKIHEHLAVAGLELDPALNNTLVNMYGKCGSVTDACAIFDTMHPKSTVSWNAMLTVYSQNGFSREALELFEQAVSEGFKPDRVAFLSVLHACGHAGLRDEAWRFFVLMIGEHGLAHLAEHYVCMIDLVGRAGFVNEVGDMLENMPLEPDASAWIALLGACQIHGEIEWGTRAAEKALHLDPKNVAPYVLLSNIFATAGRWDDVRRVRLTMEERGLEMPTRVMWCDGDLKESI